MRHGVRILAWCQMLLAVLELRRPTSGSAFRYFFQQVDVDALYAFIGDWTKVEIPGGAEDLDQLVTGGKS